MTSTQGIEAFAVRDLGLRDAKDQEIFLAAREAGAIVMTKDSDFVAILDQLGSPPQIVWLTIGNTSNAHLREVLGRRFRTVVSLLESSEALVELGELPWEVASDNGIQPTARKPRLMPTVGSPTHRSRLGSVEWFHDRADPRTPNPNRAGRGWSVDRRGA